MQYALKQTKLSWLIIIMRKELQRSRVAESNTRRSSVHFHYESEEEASSQIQNARAFNFSQSHITSDSDDTIKTTNLYSNRLHQSSLSGFAVPAFNLPKDSKKKSDQTEKAEQEQFYTFLQTFGRESELTSSQISNEFQENETVCHRSSTAPKNSSSNIAGKQDKPQPKLNQQRQFKVNNEKAEKFQIDQSDEQDQQDSSISIQQSELSQQSRRKFVFQKKVQKPQMMEFSVQTDFTPVKQVPTRIISQRPLRKRERRERQYDQGCYQNLVFTEFDEHEQSTNKKYPQRVTRDCAPLRFWLGERVDYARGGYWLQKEQ